MIRVSIFIILTLHAILGLYTSWKFGYFSLFPPFKDFSTLQIFIDLAIALGISFFVLFMEVKRKEKPLFPLYLCGIGMILLGSLAPLIYLLFEKDLYT